MRDLRDRLVDHLVEQLPAVARCLGSGWRAGRLELAAPDGRRFRFLPLYAPYVYGMARVFPAWERIGYTELPTVLVPVVSAPAVIAERLRVDLLPRCTDPRPHISVRLSGRGCRAAGYAAPAGLDHLSADARAGAQALLDGERAQGFGRSFRAELPYVEAQAVLADWHQAIDEDLRGTAGDRAALERDLWKLEIRLELFESEPRRDAIQAARAREWARSHPPPPPVEGPLLQGL